MNEEDAQIIWEEYYERIKNRRLAQANVMWTYMISAGIKEDTVIAIDFDIFSTEKLGADQVAEQLAENYETSVKRDDKLKVWMVKGTTRPSGVNLHEKQHSAWIEFMCDVSAQYSCVFSEWDLETFSPKAKFTSRTIQVDCD